MSGGPLSAAHRRALRNTGWMQMQGGWKFLFGGGMKMCAEMSRAGLIDNWGLTDAGIAARGEPSDKNAHLSPRITPEQYAEGLPA